MHYHGTLTATGAKFDASRDRGRPFAFTIGQGQVIRGWDEGVATMSLGEHAILHITSDYGYGARGAGNGVIPPNADLDFKVELLAINGQEAGTA
jgi:FKBP-type peptidyl-prolyl cis-trans isomerase